MARDILRRMVIGLSNRTFRLEMWATPHTDWRGQTRIGYSFRAAGAKKPLFTGEDFCGSPLHADDSDETVASLLMFLALRPGDTDREYFDCYSEGQLEFCQEFGEELSLFSAQLKGEEV